MKFEWDEAKNRSNIRKHGIDFTDAVEIFKHTALTAADGREDFGEDRWIAFGWMQLIVAVVGIRRAQRRHHPDHFGAQSNQARNKTLRASACILIRFTAASRQQKVGAHIMSNATKTDWKRLEAMPDSSIDTSEMPELGDDFFQRAELHTPPKQAVTMRLDADVLAWFKEQGQGYQTRINKLLRAYMLAQQKQHS
ncbi:BrnA antitoxin family protein [Caballeronia sp. LjRoot29]|uniref:BrnA antitoxin family protein n=1 Tax=Caballeronia sp. LjRoot29 TaxID=3342315 RepID=UPI003ED0AE78